MSQTRVLVLLAGAALSIGAPALAQNATLATDRAYQAELNADAASRASLLQGGGGTAGRDANGFFISDGTGDNTLYFGGTIQFRYTMSFRDDDSVGDNEDFTHGFSNNTVRLRTFGNVWSKDYFYKLVGNFNTDGDGFELEDAYAGYDFGNGFKLMAGQMKAPLLWEQLVDNEFQLASGRSVAGTFFSQGRSQGINATYEADQFRVQGAFTDGANTLNTYYNSASEADYAITARVDVALAGSDWGRFNDFTSFRNQEELAARVGGAVHWQDGGETGGPTADTQLIRYTIDGQVEGAGWNVFAAGMGENVDTEGGSESDNFGLLLQGGIFVADQFEIFARVDAIFWDDDAFGDIDDSWFLTVGANYYISPESHAAKFTAEVGYSFNDNLVLFGPDTDPTDSIDNAGAVVGSGEDLRFLGQNDDGEIYFGLQLQTMF
jgi:hypothetical protein